jgi:hypothetical protein
MISSMEVGLFAAVLSGSIAISLVITRGALELVLKAMSAQRVPVRVDPDTSRR